jgi:hypothetical protein
VLDISGHLAIAFCSRSLGSEPLAAAPGGRANSKRGGDVAGGVCVVVLMVALIAASFALDLHGYLAARLSRRPRHGRRRRDK